MTRSRLACQRACRPRVRRRKSDGRISSQQPSLDLAAHLIASRSRRRRFCPFVAVFTFALPPFPSPAPRALLLERARPTGLSPHVDDSRPPLSIPLCRQHQPPLESSSPRPSSKTAAEETFSLSPNNDDIDIDISSISRLFLPFIVDDAPCHVFEAFSAQALVLRLRAHTRPLLPLALPLSLACRPLTPAQPKRIAGLALPSLHRPRRPGIQHHAARPCQQRRPHSCKGRRWMVRCAFERYTDKMRGAMLTAPLLPASLPPSVYVALLPPLYLQEVQLGLAPRRGGPLSKRSSRRLCDSFLLVSGASSRCG